MFLQRLLCFVKMVRYGRIYGRIFIVSVSCFSAGRAPRAAALHRLKGAFINLLCRLPNGMAAKLLEDDDKMDYGAELCTREHWL